MKKFIIALLAALSILAVPAFAETVTAELAGCGIEIRQHHDYDEKITITPENFEYPVLSYKDVTYFPMSYDCARCIGLVTQWHEGALYVSYAPKYHKLLNADTVYPHEKGKYACLVAEYPIYVNGKFIDNSAEEYPILNYNGISYFPLTWRFANEEFGMDSKWDEEAGCLKISVYNYGFNAYFGARCPSLISFSINDSIVDYTLLVDMDWLSPVWKDYMYYSLDSLTNTVAKTGEERDYPYENIHQRHYRKVDPERFNTTKAVYSDGKLYYDGVFLLETKKKVETLYPISNITNNILTITLYKNKDDAVVNDWFEKYYFTVYNGKFYHIESSKKNVLTNSGLYVDNGSTLFDANELLHISPDGSTEIISDPDHGLYKLVGILDDRPLIEALWSEDNLSLVNDGFFIVEEDGSLRKYLPYLHNDGAFVVNNKLYIVRDDLECFVDTTTGEKIPYMP